MNRFALLGHPVAHSVSPAMHRAALASLGVQGTYDAVDVADEAALRERIGDLRYGLFGGANVTLPWKIAALDASDDVDASAREVSAANTLVVRDGRVVAHNTDAAGLADDLRALGAVGRTAVVIGAGGGALAAVVACRALGAGLVAVTSRSFTSSDTLLESPAADRLRALGALPCPWPAIEPGATSSKASQALRLQLTDIAASADLVVQATSAGMTGAAPGEPVAAIVPWSALRRDVLVYDLVYTPRETPFLRAARAEGLRASHGLGMLARQGARSLALWTGRQVDAEVMRLAAERALAGQGR